MGHARTNQGRAAGRDLLNTVDHWSNCLILDLRTRLASLVLDVEDMVSPYPQICARGANIVSHSISRRINR